MNVSTMIVMGALATLVLGGCASPAPTTISTVSRANDASPLDAGGLTGARAGGGASQRIYVDVDRVDLDVVLERLSLHGLDPASVEGLAATLAWRELAARADEDETVSLPDLMRWFSRRSGRAIVVDESAAHARVSLSSPVLCFVRFDD